MTKPVYRLLMEKKLGRILDADEDVHHFDRDSSNDDESNLSVIPKKVHQFIHRKRKIDWNKRVCELLKKQHVEDLSECLNVFFTARQQHLIYKKFLKLKMSKTEREYFSRSCRKKLKAIAHPTLFKVCQSMAWRTL